MTNKEAIEFIKTDISRLWNTPQNIEHKEALEMAIKALEQETCEDAISREDVLKGKIPAIISGQAIDIIPVRFIKQLPSVQPKQRTGHWNCSDNMFEYAICSECKWETEEALEYAKKYFKYCPNCGAKMQEVEE